MSAGLGQWGLRVLVLLCMGQAASALAQPVATRQTTPGGLSFKHVHMPEDTHQALGFAWKDGTAIALPGKEALAALAPALMMEGPKGSTRSAMIEDLRDLQASMALSASVNFAQGNVIAPVAKFAQAAEKPQPWPDGKVAALVAGKIAWRIRGAGRARRCFSENPTIAFAAAGL